MHHTTFPFLFVFAQVSVPLNRTSDVRIVKLFAIHSYPVSRHSDTRSVVDALVLSERRHCICISCFETCPILFSQDTEKAGVFMDVWSCPLPCFVNLRFFSAAKSQRLFSLPHSGNQNAAWFNGISSDYLFSVKRS